MSARCLHRRVRLSERADYYVCQDYVNGGETGVVTDGAAYDSDPTPSGTGNVECRDCGKVVDYPFSDRGRRRLPEWVRSAIAAFEAP